MLPHQSPFTKYFFLAFVLIVLLYGVFEAQKIIFGPRINLSEDTGAITVHTNTVELNGSVANVVDISLNGRSLFISDTGTFNERVLLAPGINTFTFNALDKFNRTTSETLQILYVPMPANESERDNIETSDSQDSVLPTQ